MATDRILGPPHLISGLLAITRTGPLPIEPVSFFFFFFILKKAWCGENRTLFSSTATAAEKATAMAFGASLSVTSRTGRTRDGSTSPTPGMAEAGARGFGCSSVVGASYSLLHTLVRVAPRSPS